MKPRILAATTIAIAALSLTACGSTSAGNSDALTIKDGTLIVGLSPDFPPMEYLDESTNELVGADVDLINEAAKRMGLEVQFEQQKFDQLINSIRTDRVDVTLSGMTDTVERQETIDFVDYYNSAGRFYVTSGDEGKYKEDADVCGKSVAVSTKTDYYPALQRFNTEVCEGAGKEPIKIVGTDSGAAARLQLDQKRADLAVQGRENLVYFEKTDKGKYEIVLGNLNEAPFGAGLRKGNTALAEKLQESLKSMHDDGSLEKILAKYGLSEGLRKPEINSVKASS